MKTKFYLAGASKEVTDCANDIEELEQSGLICTCNWTIVAFNTSLSDKELSSFMRTKFAHSDINGVTDADVFWLRCPVPGSTSTGCWFELGVAAMFKRLKQKYCIIVSGDDKRSIFTSEANLSFATHLEAKLWIIQHFGK
jgi:hypothetical protein